MNILDPVSGDILKTVKTGTNFTQYQVLDKSLYYSGITDGAENKNFALYKMDLNDGTVKETGILLSLEFLFDESGKYICYTYNGKELETDIYPEIDSFFQIIKITNIETCVTDTYNFIDDLEYWPTTVEIKNVNGEFDVSFYTDSTNAYARVLINPQSRNVTWQNK